MESTRTSSPTMTSPAEKRQKSLGIVAGEGKLPAILARSAREKGYRVVAFALSQMAEVRMEPLAEKVFKIAPGQLGRNIKLFKQEGIENIVFVGKVPKLEMLRQIYKFDWMAIKELSKLSDFNDDTIQFAVGDIATKAGVTVLTQREFLHELFPDIGVLTNKEPDAAECADVEFGLKVAKEIARLDIGQTVIVKNQMILAIEAIEGTDEAIRRAVQLANGPVVVCKVSKPNQDQRFDVPTVGMRTLNAMRAPKPGGVLAIEANETMVVEMDEMVDFCNKNGMSMVSC